MTLTIKTNNIPRLLIDSYQLTEKEREQFDYLDWAAIDEGSDSATFFRYKGRLYDLGEFMRTPEGAEEMKGWDVYASDSYFSGTLVKYCKDDNDYVIVASYYS